MARRTLPSLAVMLAVLLSIAGCGDVIATTDTRMSVDSATEAEATSSPQGSELQAVTVTVEGVADHTGHDLAGVLYEGDELTNLDADALGGFWAVIDTDDFTATETIRTPATNHAGRFPFVTNTALTVDPGTYTLVIWVDHSLGSFERWVPINTDGRGLYGCHLTFSVGNDPTTSVTAPANLQPNGWNVDCITGAITPDTDAAAAVTP